jgi:hypothetical protein
MRTLIFVAIAICLTIVPADAAQTVIPVEQFRSIELRHGGDVVVRHGSAQRVTILEGSSQYSRVRLAVGQRLTIDNCNPDCPRGYRLRMEIITPELLAVSVSHGGALRTLGAFPVQAAIQADVEQGGTIDIRSVAANAVVASVDSGGKIFTQPRQTLTAAVRSGGGITYWEMRA